MEYPRHSVGNRRDDPEQGNGIKQRQPAHSLELTEIRNGADAEEGQHEHHGTHGAFYWRRGAVQGLGNFRSAGG